MFTRAIFNRLEIKQIKRYNFYRSCPIMKNTVNFLKFTVFLPFFALLTAGCASSPDTGSSVPLPPEPGPSIVIVNNTGLEIWYVRISSVTDTAWGLDWLNENEVILSGQSRTFTLKQPLHAMSRYDFQVEDSNGDTYTRMNVHVDDNSRIVFTNNDYDVVNIPVSYDGPPVTIINNIGRTIWFVYISSTEDDSWGRDRLGREESIYNGQSVTINLPHPLEQVDRYDIRLVDSDHNKYIKWSVPVTANMRIVFTVNDLYAE
jgi:hypothetical protein